MTTGDPEEDRPRDPEDELARIREEVLARLPPPFDHPPVDPAAASVPVPPMPEAHPYAGNPPADEQPGPLPPSFLDDPPIDLVPWQHVWLADKPVAITSHRAVIGPLLVAIKKVLRRFLRAPLSDLFDRQRVFNAVLIHNFDRVGRLEETVQGIIERTVPAMIARNDALYAVQDAQHEADTAELGRRVAALEAARAVDARRYYEGLAANVKGAVVSFDGGPFLEACASRGLAASRAVGGGREPLERLAAVASGSLGALDVGGAPEQLTPSAAHALALAACKVLGKDGRLVCEGARRHHPEGMRALLEAAGFRDVTVTFLKDGDAAHEVRYAVTGVRP